MPVPIAPLAISGGLSLLGGLFGGSQNKGLSSEELSRKFGPDVLGAETLKLYNFLAQSPQFRQLLLQNSIQGSQFQNQLSGSLAQRGLSTSGIGSIAGAAGKSAIQTCESALRGGLFGEAMQTSLQSLLQRLQAYSGGQQQQMGQPTGMQNLLGSSLGAFSQIAPFWQTGGGGTSTAGQGWM